MELSENALCLEHICLLDELTIYDLVVDDIGPDIVEPFHVLVILISQEETHTVVE